MFVTFVLAPWNPNFQKPLLSHPTAQSCKAKAEAPAESRDIVFNAARQGRYGKVNWRESVAALTPEKEGSPCHVFVKLGMTFNSHSGERQTVVSWDCWTSWIPLEYYPLGRKFLLQVLMNLDTGRLRLHTCCASCVWSLGIRNDVQHLRPGWVRTCYWHVISDVMGKDAKSSWHVTSCDLHDSPNTLNKSQ